MNTEPASTAAPVERLVMPLSQDEQFFCLMRRWAAVGKCMETLTDKERQAIELLFRDRATTSEIAKTLKVTKARATMIQNKAVRIMSDMLCGRIDDSEA